MTEPDDLADLQNEFLVLKEGTGITAEKVALSPTLMRLLKTSKPRVALQQVIDDVADGSGPEFQALRSALCLVREGEQPAAKLVHRRKAMGVPVSTLKYREKRAVELLYRRWITRGTRVLPTVLTAQVATLPCQVQGVFSGHEVNMRAAKRDDLLIIEIAAVADEQSGDVLVLGQREGELFATYSCVEERNAALRIILPFNGERIVIGRLPTGAAVAEALVEGSVSDGSMTSHKFPGDLINAGGLIEVLGVPGGHLTTVSFRLSRDASWPVHADADAVTTT